MTPEEHAEFRGRVNALLAAQSKSIQDMTEDIAELMKDVQGIKENFSAQLARWSVIMSIAGSIAYTVLQKLIK